MSNVSKDSKPDSDDTFSPPDRSTVILLLGDITSVTWRMFVPTIGFMTAGFYADKQFGTFPWLFAIGVLLGFLTAGLLIKQQLSKKV